MAGIEYLRGLDDEQPAVSGKASVDLTYNNKIKLGDQLNDYQLSKLIRQSVSNALPTMLEQLAELRNQPNDMTKYRNRCDENV
jgi:hypothetical protein